MKKQFCFLILVAGGIAFSACQKDRRLLADNLPLLTPVTASFAPIESPSLPPTQNSEVKLSSPKANDVVTSPLTVAGKAPGSWFFEGQIRATLKDETGKILAQSPLLAQGDWMTTELVDFSGALNFIKPAKTTTATLIIENDNPSGLPENGKSASYTVDVR